MKGACVGVLSIIELKNARWNIEIREFVCSLNLGVLDVVFPISRHCIEIDVCINTLRENKQVIWRRIR